MQMKKKIVIMLAVCLLVAAAMGYLVYRGVGLPDSPAEPPVSDTPADAAEPAPEAAPEPEIAAEMPAELQMDELDYDTLDIKSLYLTRDPQESVLTVRGREESWGDYFYYLSAQVDYVEKLLVQYYVNFGAELLWSDVADTDGSTFADLAVNGAEKLMLQLEAIEGFAEDNGVELTEEDRQAMAQQAESEMKSCCGEDATEADFEAYLAEHYMSRELYDRISAANTLYREGFSLLYGESGDVIDDEAVLQYLADNEYISVNQILLATVDLKTGEELDEAVVAEKAAMAQRLAEELQAIEDPIELQERFAQLKEEYCEDAGKALYAAGYTFTPHTMASSFERACNLLEPYEVSDPVQSNYGYHIIMKLPADAGALLFNSAGAPVTARSAAAQAEYDARLEAYADTLEIAYAEGFEKPDLLAYVNG